MTNGVDDRQAVITFAKHFADWRGMFAGNACYAQGGDRQHPEAFNKGSAQRTPARPRDRS